MQPVDCANRWRQWSVKGSAEVLMRVLDNLEANLPFGWRRLRAEDPLPNLGPDDVWYALAPAPTRAGVTLSVRRWRETELLGGWVKFTSPPDPVTEAIPAAWDEIMRLLDAGIVPAARAAGATVSAPTVEVMFLADLPRDVAAGLQGFSQEATKRLPMTEVEAERWRSFVVNAFRMKAVVDSRLLVAWLVHAGWGRDAAAELGLRFFDECRLLSRYEEASAA